MLSIDLKGKTAVITGASRGIGKAIAEVFADAGASLILLSRNKSLLEQVTKELNTKYKKPIANSLVLDVSNPEEVEKTFSKIDSIDILINNAGVHFTSSIKDMDIEKWKELLEINLHGAMYCSKFALPKMLSKKWGRIINIASTSGKYGEAYSGAYCSSKFALIGFTQSLANEVAREGITVNAVCPGWTETAMAEGILHDDTYARLSGISINKLKEYSLEAVPIGRYVSPYEVAYLTAFLANNHASAITGQAINICGGICMH
ncbi:MAG: SDR family oxidoreductase [Candidatus Melainabacteria bacterium]|nr:SDR family oxidoreductase [Candidatus Melainabacteria bacterium]MBI3308458.1 SDR family oxidoreductase [Candidatus Melainabacteria bacterium]